METQCDQESLEVADAIRSMSTAEIRALIDDVYASGFVQSLQGVSTVLAKADEQAAVDSRQSAEQ